MGSQRTKVLSLYRNILKCHRSFLPPAQRFLGDMYVRDEFRRHATVTEPTYIAGFLVEWGKYYELMKAQSGTGAMAKPGVALQPEDLEHFSDEQLGQLHELWQESKKPRVL